MFQTRLLPKQKPFHTPKRYPYVTIISVVVVAVVAIVMIGLAVTALGTSQTLFGRAYTPLLSLPAPLTETTLLTPSNPTTSDNQPAILYDPELASPDPEFTGKIVPASPVIEFQEAVNY